VKVFIATDSNKVERELHVDSSVLSIVSIDVVVFRFQVIDEIKTDYNEGRDLLFDDQQVRYEKGTILQLREHPGSVNQQEESVNALKDIWLLSQGSAFIGTRSSFFGRTGFLLM